MKKKLLFLAVMVVVLLAGFSIASSYSHGQSKIESDNQGKATRLEREYGYPTSIYNYKDDSHDNDSDVDYFFVKDK